MRALACPHHDDRMTWHPFSVDWSRLRKQIDDAWRAFGSQTAVLERSGISRSALDNWKNIERGRNLPELENLAKYAEACEAQLIIELVPKGREKRLLPVDDTMEEAARLIEEISEEPVFLPARNMVVNRREIALRLAGAPAVLDRRLAQTGAQSAPGTEQDQAADTGVDERLQMARRRVEIETQAGLVDLHPGRAGVVLLAGVAGRDHAPFFNGFELRQRFRRNCGSSLGVVQRRGHR